MVTKAIIPGRAVSELHRTGFGEFAVLTVQAVGFGERGANGVNAGLVKTGEIGFCIGRCTDKLHIRLVCPNGRQRLRPASQPPKKQ